MTPSLTALCPAALAHELFKLSKFQSIGVPPSSVEQGFSSVHAVILFGLGEMFKCTVFPANHAPASLHSPAGQLP